MSALCKLSLADSNLPIPCLECKSIITCNEEDVIVRYKSVKLHMRLLYIYTFSHTSKYSTVKQWVIHVCACACPLINMCIVSSLEGYVHCGPLTCIYYTLPGNVRVKSSHILCSDIRWIADYEVGPWSQAMAGHSREGVADSRRQ